MTKESYFNLDLLLGSSKTTMAFSYGFTLIVNFKSPSDGGSSI